LELWEYGALKRVFAGKGAFFGKIPQKNPKVET
jgi:hypothetical protein